MSHSMLPVRHYHSNFLLIHHHLDHKVGAVGDLGSRFFTAGIEDDKLLIIDPSIGRNPVTGARSCSDAVAESFDRVKLSFAALMPQRIVSYAQDSVLEYQ
jgi:hypothetical protein